MQGCCLHARDPARIRRPSNWRLLLSVLLLLVLAGPGISFSSGNYGRRKQPTASVYREQTGSSISRSLHESAQDEEELFNYTLSAHEKKLTSSIFAAGQSGSWSRFSKLWKSYSGTSVPVYCAAMQAAFRCGQYQEAAKMYKRLRSLPDIQINRVVMHRGLKIFGKMRDSRAVDELWSEAIETNRVNKVIAAARIDAAASLGDIEGAAAGLDFMTSNDLDPDVPAFNSALNACGKANPPSKSAAMYLFRAMIKQSLQPTVVTYASLLRAHERAASNDIQAICTDMASRGVEPNHVFAEAYISAMFKGARLRGLGLPGIRKLVQNMSDRRRSKLQYALNSFEASKVMTGLCRDVKKSL